VVSREWEFEEGERGGSSLRIFPTHVFALKRKAAEKVVAPAVKGKSDRASVPITHAPTLQPTLSIPNRRFPDSSQLSTPL
jgi:hypothetical protein